MRWKGLLPATLTVLLLAAAPAAATTYTVTGTGDDPGATCLAASCQSLRAALAAATDDLAPPSVINVPAGTIQLDDQQGALFVSASVSIVGAGARATILAGPSGASVLDVNNTADATVSGVTLRDGNGFQGANVYNLGTLTLDRVRVTGGSANDGDGGGILNRGTMTIRRSYIGENDTIALGGGIANQAYEGPASLAISDSTISGNTSSGDGAGIWNAGAQLTLERVTITGNTSEASSAAGIYSEDGTVTVHGSIVAGNRAGSATLDCAGVLTSTGGNISTTACGFETSGVTPSQLFAARDTSGETEIFPLVAGSPALDRYPCSGADQRDLPRPQGSACDAGAYELAVAPPPTPTPTPTPTATATAPPSPPAVPTPTPTAVPTPVYNRTVVVEPERGTVRVRLRGKKGFITLTAGMSIPFGSTLDTKRGRVELTSLPSRGGARQTAVFYAGIFKVVQAPGGVTELRLSEALAPCGRARARRSSLASEAAKKPKTRKLWGSGKGKFRTKGRYSAATVRGTKWLVQDGCRYTRTRVTQGSVSVRDSVRRRTVVLRRGAAYTARPR